MNRSRLASAAIALLLLLVVPTPTVAGGQEDASGEDAAAALSKLDVQDAYAVEPKGGTVEVILPIVVGKGAAAVAGADTEVVVVGVDAARARGLAKYFGLEMAPTAADPAAVLRVGTSKGTPPAPGTYRLLATVSPAGNSLDGQPAVPFHAAFNVVVPAGVLAPTPKLEVVQEVTCPLGLYCFGQPDEVQEVLSVRETSGVAASGPLTLTVSDVVTPDHGTAPTFTSTGGEVGAGSTAAIPYEVGGDPDPGTYTATLRLAGGPGTTASDVALTVTRRESGWTFVLLAAVGLGLGLLVRLLVVQRIERRDARTAAAKLAAKIQQAADAATDPMQKAALLVARSTLAGKVEDGSAADLAEAVTTAKTQVSDAAKAAAERLSAATVRRNVLDAALARLGAVGVPAIEGQIAAAREALVPVDQQLALKNGAGADALLTSLGDDQGAAVLTAASTWADHVRSYVTEVCGPKGASLPVDAEEAVGDMGVAMALVAAVEGVPLLDLEPPIRAVCGVLRNIDAALAATLVVAEQAIDAVPEAYADPVLRSETAELGAIVSTRPLDHAAGIAKAQAVGAAVRSSIERWSSGGSEKSAVDAALARRDYAGAVRILATAAAPPNDGWKRRLGNAGSPAVVVLRRDLDLTGRLPVASVAEAGGGAPHPYVPPPDPPPKEIEVVVPNAGLTLIVKVGLFIAVAIALLLALYLVLPETMVGSTTQQLAVLIWAVSLPPTYEGLAAQLPKVLKGPS